MNRNLLLLGCTIMLTLVGAAQASYVSSFEAPLYSGSPTGVSITGQDGWYLPGISGSHNGLVFTYTGNSLNISVNPLGGEQFEGGLGDATGPARAQHAVDFSAGGMWHAEWDCTGKWNNPAGPAVNNIGSFSLQPSTSARYFQQLMSWGGAGNNYQGPFSPPTDHTSDFQKFHMHWGYFTALSPTVIAFAVPGPEFLDLPVNEWYHVTVTWNFNGAQILAVSIRNITAGGPTVSYDVTSLGWYLMGGPNSTNALPTDVRLFAGGNGDVSAWDNLTIGPAGACCAADGTCTLTNEASCTGTWQGAGTTCSPNPCAPPTGACCLANGGCTITTQVDCVGTWQGAGTTCTPNNCPFVKGDVNCDHAVNTDDIPFFVAALIGGYTGCDITLADMNSDGLINGTDIQFFVNVLLGG